VTRARFVKRRLLTGSAATALLLALSTLPGCLFVVGDDDNRGEPVHEEHWGWIGDYDFDSSHTSNLDDLESRLDELEAHAAACADCCANKD